MEKEYKGSNGTVILKENHLIIKRGVKGFLLGGMMLRGDKTIPYSSIVAVQLKKAGMTAGYIQFTLAGGSEAKAGLLQSAYDENTVNFFSNKNGFAELKEIVEGKIGKVNTDQSHSSLNDIEKLAELKSKGIITEKEFEQKKKQLLGL